MVSGLSADKDYRLRLQWTDFHEDETDVFPMCRIADVSSIFSSSSNTSHSNSGFSSTTLVDFPSRFHLSICTVSEVDDAVDILRFIEHYRVLRVQHFFIYDTSSANKENNSVLPSLLKSYVDTGMVTLIPWHYSSCARSAPLNCPDSMLHMTNGFVEALVTPPAKVDVEAALSSCFLRFRGFSEWILSLDINEFIQLDASTSMGNIKAVDIPSLFNSIIRIQPGTNFVDFEIRSYHACNRQGNNSRWMRTVEALNISTDADEPKEGIISTRVRTTAVRTDVPLSKAIEHFAVKYTGFDLEVGSNLIPSGKRMLSSKNTTDSFRFRSSSRKYHARYFGHETYVVDPVIAFSLKLR